jgi:hypothetical protein
MWLCSSYLSCDGLVAIIAASTERQQMRTMNCKRNPPYVIEIFTLRSGSWNYNANVREQRRTRHPQPHRLADTRACRCQIARVESHSVPVRLAGSKSTSFFDDDHARDRPSQCALSLPHLAVVCAVPAHPAARLVAGGSAGDSGRYSSQSESSRFLRSFYGNRSQRL